MRILVACEWSGRVRDQFRMLGHDAYSCDIEPTDPQSIYPQYHIQQDVTSLLYGAWDLIIAFPPCTYLTNAANGWLYPDWRINAQSEAVQFVDYIWNSPCPRIAIENPVGKLSTQWRTPSQIIQPFWFGDPYTKKTCLWLKGLPALERDEYYWHGPLSAWVSSGTNPLKGGTNTPKERGKTFLGIARAMARQWGSDGL